MYSETCWKSSGRPQISWPQLVPSPLWHTTFEGFHHSIAMQSGEHVVEFKVSGSGLEILIYRIP